MAAGFPVKANYATGDVLSAANMNDLSATLNYIDPTAKTNGFVLTRNSGATGGLEWAAAGGSGGGLTLLQTLSLSGSSTTSSTLAAASYKDYRIVIKNAYVDTNGDMWVRFNGDSASGYYRATLGSDTTTAFAQNAITTYFQIAGIPALSPVYNGVSGIIDLPRINDTDFQFIQSTMYSNFNSSSLRNNLSSGVYDGSAAITTITFGTTQSFSGGTAYIYGVN
jgi:hypothetical protein